MTFMSDKAYLFKPGIRQLRGMLSSAPDMELASTPLGENCRGLLKAHRQTVLDLLEQHEGVLTTGLMVSYTLGTNVGMQQHILQHEHPTMESLAADANAVLTNMPATGFARFLQRQSPPYWYLDQQARPRMCFEAYVADYERLQATYKQKHLGQHLDWECSEFDRAFQLMLIQEQNQYVIQSFLDAVNPPTPYQGRVN